MIIIPADLKDQFESSFTEYHELFKNIQLQNYKEEQLKNKMPINSDPTSVLGEGEHISCYDVNKLINDYQKRIEDITSGSHAGRFTTENAYCLVETYSLITVIAALGKDSVKIRLYFALNKSGKTTIAIVGEDEAGNPLMPKNESGYYAYENFGGGGTIDSSSNDLDCK